MIELLSRLDAAGSAVIAQMQDSGRKEGAAERERVSKLALEHRCPACKGKGGVEVLDVWHWCAHCAGSGERLVMAGKQTRSRTPPEGMTAEAIIGLTVGMPAHWLDAAMVRVRQDRSAAARLRVSVFERLVLPTAQAWRLEDEERELRAAGLAILAVAQVPMRESDGLAADEDGREYFDGRVTASHATGILGVSERTWRSTWRDRHDVIVYGVESWISAAGYYMARTHRAGKENAA